MHDPKHAFTSHDWLQHAPYSHRCVMDSWLRITHFRGCLIFKSIKILSDVFDSLNITNINHPRWIKQLIIYFATAIIYFINIYWMIGWIIFSYTRKTTFFFRSNTNDCSCLALDIHKKKNIIHKREMRKKKFWHFSSDDFSYGAECEMRFIHFC